MVRPVGSMTWLVPTVEMFTTDRPVSIARRRAIASCCSFSSVPRKSALFVWNMYELGAVARALPDELVVDDVEADREAGDGAAEVEHRRVRAGRVVALDRGR